MSGINEELKEIEAKAESWIKNELKENWFKILLFIAVAIFVFAMIDDVRNWMHRSSTPTVINQTTPAPININSAGNKTYRVPDIYVNVQAQERTQAVAEIKEKKDPKTDPDFVVNQKQQIYTMSFNGSKPYSFMPEFKESSKLDKGQFVYNSESKMNINVEVPTPIWEIGIAKSFKSDYAIEAGVRLGKTPFNIWGYASKADQAIGIKFVQYGNTSSSKKETSPEPIPAKKEETTQKVVEPIKEGVKK